MNSLREAVTGMMRDTEQMMREAEQMMREAEDKAEQTPQSEPPVTYRLRAKSLRQRFACAWRVLWDGNVTVRVSASAKDDHVETNKKD